MSFNEYRLFPNDPKSDSSSETDSSVDLDDTIIENILNQTPDINLANLNISETNTPNPNMANVLKPEYLKMIPEFSGESELLPRFIEICEKIVTKFYNAQDPTDFQNEYLMSSILAKVTGDAAIKISSCLITNWAELKTALHNTYSDKRDVFSLGIEMTELKQGFRESVFDFYNNILTLLNLQIAYLTIHLENANETAVLTAYLRKYALRVLLRGLREPIGSLMRTKNPADLNTALNMLTNDFQLEINNQNSKNHISQPKSKFNNYKGNLQMHKQHQIFPKPLPLTNYPHNYQPKPRNMNTQSNNTSNNFSNRNNFNNNNNYQNQPGPSYRNDVFNPNPNVRVPKPTPMSISTRNTNMSQGRQNFTTNNFNNQNRSSPNVQIEELFNLHSDPHVDFPSESEKIDDGADFLGN